MDPAQAQAAAAAAAPAQQPPQAVAYQQPQAAVAPAGDPAVAAAAAAAAVAAAAPPPVAAGAPATDPAVAAFGAGVKFTRSQLKDAGFSEDAINAMADKGEIAPEGGSPMAPAAVTAGAPPATAAVPSASQPAAAIPAATATIPTASSISSRGGYSSIPAGGFDASKSMEMLMQYNKMSDTVEKACDEVERLQGVEADLLAKNEAQREEIEALKEKLAEQEKAVGPLTKKVEDLQAALAQQVVCQQEVVTPSIRPCLGLEVTEQPCHPYHSGRFDLVVRSVSQDSGASDGGVKQGDILRKFNGVPIRRKSDFGCLVQQTQIGAPIRLQVEREHGNNTVLTVCTQPKFTQPLDHSPIRRASSTSHSSPAGSARSTRSSRSTRKPSESPPSYQH